MTDSTSALSVELIDGVAVITFDLPGESVNKFTPAVIEEFAGVIDRFDSDETIRAAVLLSGKPDIFIAGADIEQFLAFGTAEAATRASAAGQALLDRVERGRVPLVCAIHGACLGGGVELALASAHRIATDHPKTVLALPETQLGLIPGTGGTQRLPRVVGLQAALDMILTAKNVRAKKALQMGLVDEMVHPSILREVAMQRAREFAGGQRPRLARRAQGERPVTPARGQPARSRGRVPQGARDDAQEVARELSRADGGVRRGRSRATRARRQRGFEVEARLFGEMAMTAVSKELVFLFFATTSLKKDVAEGAPPLPVNRLGVLGTGFMGAGIAAIAAQQMVPVRFKDNKHEAVLKGLAAVRDVLKDALKKKRITRQQFEDQMSLVSGTISVRRLPARGPRDRGGVRGPRGEARGAARSREAAAAARGVRDEHVDASRSRASPRRRRGRIG